MKPAQITKPLRFEGCYDGKSVSGPKAPNMYCELPTSGGKNAKKRAVVAVARKLAVLLHQLCVTGDVYEPLHHTGAETRTAQATAA